MFDTVALVIVLDGFRFQGLLPSPIHSEGRRKDQHLKGAVASGRFRQRGDADEVAWFDVVHRRSREARQLPTVLQDKRARCALAGLYGKRRPRQTDDRSANADAIGRMSG
jgi:hypothetical protein